MKIFPLAIIMFWFFSCVSTSKPIEKEIFQVQQSGQSREITQEKSNTKQSDLKTVGINAQNQYFDGNGGAGISIAILAPQGYGIVKDLEYLPTLVQGVLVSDFSKYSKISVLDRVNLDKIFEETLNGIYPDENSFIQLGHVVGTEYMMTGAITKTQAGYAIQLQIANSQNGITKASYSGTCTAAELDNFSGIKYASMELLIQMGIALTELARNELLGFDNQKNINAQTALAQGISAQKKGTVVEALSYYYNAVAFDPSLPDAANRLSVLSSDISSGNIGENVRNDIQRRNAWLKILTECEVFFKNYLPYEILYNSDITQGKIDYVKETVDLSFRIESRPTTSYKIIENILDGLTKTGKREEWGLGYWPMDSDLFSHKPQGDPSSIRVDFHKNVMGIIITVSLQNDQEKIIATQTVALNNKISFVLGTERHDWYSKENYQHWGQRNNGGWIYLYDTCRLDLSGDSSVVNFRNVNANDITDKLTIKIEKINGIDADIASKNGYVKIFMKN
jgi:TolB-like protein